MKYLIRLINVTALVSVLLKLRSGAMASLSLSNVLWRGWFIYLQHLLSYIWVATAGLQNLLLIDQLQGKAFSRAGWRGTSVWLDCNQGCFIFTSESPRLVVVRSPGHESCPLSASSCSAGQGWVAPARTRESCSRTPLFLHECLPVFRPFLQQNVLWELLGDLPQPPWGPSSLVLCLALFPPGLTADTWGFAEV